MVVVSQCFTEHLDRFVSLSSECNLHTTLEVVMKMRTLGLKPSCESIVMLPDCALRRKQAHQLHRQLALGTLPRDDSPTPAQLTNTIDRATLKRCKQQSMGDASGWINLPADVLMDIMRDFDDGQRQILACVCPAWRDIIDRHVQHLSFGWCAAKHVEANAAVRGASVLFQCLHSVELKLCSSLSNVALMMLMHASRRTLQVIDLSGCSTLTDSGLTALARCCTALTSLKLSSCQQLTDTAFVGLGLHCTRLAVLFANGCEQLTDVGLCALARGCRCLTDVSLGWCERISDVGAQALASYCPMLRSLELCGCFNVGDAGVMAVASHCPRLTFLGLHCCRHVSDASMWALASHVSSLQSLNISGCMLLTAPAVQAVLDTNPSLHTCTPLRTVIVSGCLTLIPVSCACRARKAQLRTGPTVG